MFEPIRTERLQLVPSSLEIERAVLLNRSILGRLTGFIVPESWPGRDWVDALADLIGLYEVNPDWCCWNRNIVCSADNTLIGSVGCACPPDESGSVNIGYFIIPEYRRRGFALEAVTAYLRWLREQESVRTIKAQCLIGNVPSLRILEMAGMIRIGMFNDGEGMKIDWIDNKSLK